MTDGIFGRAGDFRLYGDLAWLFPFLTPLDHYLEETRVFSDLLVREALVPVRTLLHLGCGGGQNDFVFKDRFRVTGVDRSEDLLARARRLNPEARYVRGDLREIRLGETFDAVAAVDSLDYMLSFADLEAAFATARAHLVPGGAFFFLLETTREGFRQNRTRCHEAGRGEVELAYVENSYDPDPADTVYETTMIYLIRRSGRLTIEHDRHLCGLFSEAEVLDRLRRAGFEARREDYVPAAPATGGPAGGESDWRTPLFIGRRPPA